MEHILKKAGIILFITILLTPLLYAQEKDDFAPTKQLGLSLSSVTGAGIHYIYPYNEKDNLKFVGIYIYNDDNDGKNSFFSLGAEYQRDLRETSMQRIYAFGGLHIDNSFSEDTFFESNGQQDKFFSLGGGMGVDFGDSKQGLAFNIHIAYQFTKGFGDEDKTRIGLGAGFGIGYNF